MHLQNPKAVLMIRPATFFFNEQTAGTNAFQQQAAANRQQVLAQAQQEFDTMVDQLRAHHIEVFVVADTPEPEKPDAIFPNNWVSFHHDGRVILYPMMAPNRRHERRIDILEWLRQTFIITEVLDESTYEQEGKFLEGTGSLIFDHAHQAVYASRSARTHEELVMRVASLLNYQAVVFDAVDEQGLPIYHTNVMLWVGSGVAVVCLDAVHSEADQDALLDSFARAGHRVVAISYAQMKAFAGNMLEVADADGMPYILLSQTAFNSLLPGQINALSKTAELLPLAVPTIERYGGGSVRCMVAGIHLQKK